MVNNKTTTVRSFLLLNSTYTINRKIDDEQQPRKWWRHRLFPPTSHKEAPHSHQNCTTVTSLLHKREKKEKRLRNGISSSVSRLNLETASVRSSLLLPFCSSSSFLINVPACWIWVVSADCCVFFLSVLIVENLDCWFRSWWFVITWNRGCILECCVRVGRDLEFVDS